MSSLDNDSRQEKVAQRRPPPVVISEPEVDSPNAAGVLGAVVMTHARPLIRAPVQSLLGAGQRLPPAVAAPLSALAGPENREPLVYTGDAIGSLSVLRQDVMTSYRAICGALGEPERTTLVSGSLPQAAALGLRMPIALRAPSAARLSPLETGGRLPPAPLLLPPPPLAAPAPCFGQIDSVAMGLGADVGIESVGTGADGPARILAAGAGSGLPAGAGPRIGTMRSLSAGHRLASGRVGLPPLGPGRDAVKHWPMGRPMAGSGLGSSPATSVLCSSDGPRIAMLSGFSRPKDAESDFLGEESVVVYPPPGRHFSGGSWPAGLGPAGPAHGQLIDAMEDFRFRGGGRKNIKFEDSGDPSRVIPAFRRNDDLQLEVFLKEYARERSEAKAAGQGIVHRYRMPF